jgi:uncharacterized peroxidase-related enzyme
MTTIAPLDISAADPTTAATLKAVKDKIGMVPNLYATLAKAPAALNSLLQINQAIGAGRLTAKEREVVALATSQANTCHYCLSAHTLLGKNAGLSLEQTQAVRAGKGSTTREAAIAAFSKILVEKRGHIGADALRGYKDAGLSEGDLLEIVANVAATTLTNYTNNIAGTPIDFPVVDVAVAA